MDKLTKKDQTRLRQCEVVIWRLLHEKAALDYSNYSTAWQSWFDDRVSDLGNELDRILHNEAGNLRLTKQDYRKFWIYAYELRDLRRKGEDHLERENVQKLLIK
jgi:hypothetical protein